jgi:uncharacterized membrane protein YgcG
MKSDRSSYCHRLSVFSLFVLKGHTQCTNVRDGSQMYIRRSGVGSGYALTLAYVAHSSRAPLSRQSAPPSPLPAQSHSVLFPAASLPFGGAAASRASPIQRDPASNDSNDSNDSARPREEGRGHGSAPSKDADSFGGGGAGRGGGGERSCE